ncbi:MAG: hexose kinase [Armatimonadetes bacterium]|nr:hexose kinase [Armatimonadota bacterium]
MILTVTPNTALDRVLFLPRLRIGGRNQATASLEAMGGKGCCVSLVLARLGTATLATGLAGGDAGRRMEALLRAAGADTDFVWTAGETRVNLVLLEDNGRHTTVCAEGLLPTPADAGRLIERLRGHAAEAEAIVVAGSPPAGWSLAEYEAVVRAARGAGKPLVVDAAGAALHAALCVRPEAIKPNRDELAQAVGRPIRRAQEAAQEAAALVEKGAGMVLASLGRGGAVLVTRAGAWRAPALSVAARNPAGAGDAMAAALALGLARGWRPARILREAIALAAAAVEHPATGDLDPAAVPGHRERVRVRRVHL